MHKLNLKDVQAARDIERPKPGGYVVRIVNVRDDEEKECLTVEWDFVSGKYAGANQASYRQWGKWPYAARRSYKTKALPFFKQFVECVESSNDGYEFDEEKYELLSGKLMGIVMSEREYLKPDGSIGIGLSVASIKTVDEIESGDYKVPELQRLDTAAVPETFAPLKADPVPPVSVYDSAASDLSWQDKAKSLMQTYYISDPVPAKKESDTQSDSGGADWEVYSDDPNEELPF